MGSGIAVGIYVAALTFVVALTAGFALSRVQVHPDLKRRVLLFFTGVACLAPLLQTHLAILLVGTVILWSLLPSDKTLTTPFCLAALFVVPGFYAYDIPFPGINFLITYKLWMAAAWLAFLPLLFRYSLRFNLADFCMVAYVLCMVILDFRGGSVTSGMREGLIQVSWLALPYFAVSRSLGTPAERNYMFQAILIVAVILCCATIYTQIVGWHYLSFTEIGGQYSTERRFGLIRTGATLASGMFGLLCCFALMLLISRRDLVRNSFSRIFGALLFFVGILASGARGAMVSGVIATCVWLAARRLTVGMVWVSAVTLVVGLPVLIDTMTSAELTILGNQDTISYRQQLLVAAMQQFAEAPLFGDRNFIRSPHLAHLVQGQQIIDIVNSYLQMLLAYGIVGLALFALAAFYVARGVVRKLSSRQCDALEASDLALMLGFLAGYLSLISTTSQTSYLAFFGAMLLGLGRAAGATDAERALAGRGRSAA